MSTLIWTIWCQQVGPSKSTILVHSAVPVEPCSSWDDAPLLEQLRRVTLRPSAGSVCERWTEADRTHIQSGPTVADLSPADCPLLLSSSDCPPSDRPLLCLRAAGGHATVLCPQLTAPAGRLCPGAATLWWSPGRESSLSATCLLCSPTSCSALTSASRPPAQG